MMEDVGRGCSTQSVFAINVLVAGNYLFQVICDLKLRNVCLMSVNSKAEETLIVNLSGRR